MGPRTASAARCLASSPQDLHVEITQISPFAATCRRTRCMPLPRRPGTAGHRSNRRVASARSIQGAVRNFCRTSTTFPLWLRVVCASLSRNEEDAYDEVRDEGDAHRDHGPSDGVERANTPGCASFLRRLKRHVGGPWRSADDCRESRRVPGCLAGTRICDPGTSAPCADTRSPGR